MTRIGSFLASLGFDSLGSLFSMLPGCRFRPLDDELIGFLKDKMHGNESEFELIPVIDLCQHEPREIPTLPEFSQINPKDPEWYFFSPIVYKYRDRKMVERSTKAGYWKPTGKDRVIKDEAEDIIGKKKTLVFYEGRNPGTKTNWVYHEYQLASPLSDKNPYVLCHLMKKAEKATVETSNSNAERGELSASISYAMNSDGEPSSNRSPDFADPPTEYSFSEVNDIPQAEDSPMCLDAPEDDYLELMKKFTLTNTTPMLSETHDLGEFTPNFPNQSSTCYYSEPISPYSHALMPQYFEEAPLSYYGENQIDFAQPNSYSSIGEYD